MVFRQVHLAGGVEIEIGSTVRPGRRAPRPVTFLPSVLAARPIMLPLQAASILRGGPRCLLGENPALPLIAMLSSAMRQLHGSQRAPSLGVGLIVSRRCLVRTSLLTAICGLRTYYPRDRGWLGPTRHLPRVRALF